MKEAQSRSQENDDCHCLYSAEDSLACKVSAYNRANRAVTVLCNHQRAIPKTFEESMKTLQRKVRRCLQCSCPHSNCFTLLCLLGPGELWRARVWSGYCCSRRLGLGAWNYSGPYPGQPWEEPASRFRASLAACHLPARTQPVL